MTTGLLLEPGCRERWGTWSPSVYFRPRFVLFQPLPRKLSRLGYFFSGHELPELVSGVRP